ncbi:ATP-binding protein [Paucibacter sp. APW11]|uniref:ATP-binding protein n=1 Tax=Roseateles aquae TaxID=3077235 RepID=A0ABU3PAL7_9BURK|nr:ATP-binding protein [Paucibacter sp. APW11]MDT8999631.1 ATP-binding protein [Paucibacter sp. APW11]
MRFLLRERPHLPPVARLCQTLLLLLSLLLTLPGQAQVLNRAELVLSDAERFPDGEPTQTQSLPDLWAQSRPGYTGQAWYRWHAQLQPSGRRLGLYIDKVCSNYQLRLNGQLVFAQGRYGEPLTDRCDQPQLLDLPAEWLLRGENVIDLRLSGYEAQALGPQERSTRLSPPELGEYDTLARRQALAEFWRLGLPRLLSAMVLMLSLCMGLLALMQKQERQLPYLAGLMLAWPLLGARPWLADLGCSRLSAELLMLAVLALFALCAVQFLLRQQGLRRMPIDAALLAQCLLLPLTVGLAPAAWQGRLAHGWQALIGLEILLAMAWHLWLRQLAIKQAGSGQGQMRQDFALMAALLGLGACAVLMEYAMQALRLPLWLPLSPLAVPLLLIGLGLQQLAAQVRGRRGVEQKLVLNELRLQERIAEVERNFSAMAEQKLEQVTERERKRIAADLHDDLGAKLLTIVHTSESDRISTLAREALEEMRLSVRGLTGKPVQLLDALGDWRAEVVSRLGQANILAEWKSPAEDIVHTLPARAYVQTTRILREAVSNIIKHSGATHCIIGCNVQDGDFQVIIQDNGQGIPMELDGRLDRGHGMASMKSRAKQLQGQCLVESGPGWGTVIRLTIPL